MPNQPTQMPTIPTPLKGNPDSVQDVLMAMKQILDQFVGTVGGSPVTRTVLQDDTPPVPTAVNPGDLWINVNNGIMRYWNGGDWLYVKPPPP